MCGEQSPSNLLTGLCKLPDKSPPPSKQAAYIPVIFQCAYNNHGPKRPFLAQHPAFPRPDLLFTRLLLAGEKLYFEALDAALAFIQDTIRYAPDYATRFTTQREFYAGQVLQ